MIIFSGLGILIPVFYFAGFIPVMLLCTAIRMDFVKSFALSTWAGAAMIWLFAKTIGRPKVQQLYDPQTRRPVTLVSSHTIFFMGGKVWAVIAALFALFLTVESWRVKGSFALLDDLGSLTPPGAASFFAADNRLSKAGAEDAGNSEDARKLAESVSKALKSVRVLTSDANGETSSLKGQFVTYCQLSKEACVFLVHAPDIAKRSPEEKAVIVDAAWAMAQAHMAELKPAPAQLAVAVRGATRYVSVWIGVPAPLNADGVAPGVRQRLPDSGKHQLYKFFEPAEDEKTKLMSKNKKTEDAKPSVTSVTETPEAKKTEAIRPADSATSSSALPSVVRPTEAATLPTAERDWKSTDGRPLHAALLRVTNDAGGSGVFRRTDGQEFTIPFDKFTVEDQVLLKSFVPAPK